MAKPKKPLTSTKLGVAREKLEEALQDLEDELPIEDELSDKIHTALELASDDDRLEEYRRVSAFNRHCGVDVHEVGASAKSLTEVLKEWEDTRGKIAKALATAQIAQEELLDATYECLDTDRGSIPASFRKLAAAIHALHGDRSTETSSPEVDRLLSALSHHEDTLRGVLI